MHSLHSHDAIRRDPGVTDAGVRSPLRVGCHCLASSGARAASEVVWSAPAGPTQEVPGQDDGLSHIHLSCDETTRQPKDAGLKELVPYIMFGASPRASINLILTGRALAFVRGRQYVLPQDVLDMAYDVMRHRLVLSYEALSDNVTADDLLKQIFARIPVPVVPLREHANGRQNA